MSSFSEQVAQMEVELNTLRIQNDSLTRSNQYLTQHNHRLEGDLLVLANERDAALRKVSEVSQIIDGIGKMAIDGMTKMRTENAMRQVRERHHNPDDRMPDPPMFLADQREEG